MGIESEFKDAIPNNDKAVDVILGGSLSDAIVGIGLVLFYLSIPVAVIAFVVWQVVSP